MKYLELYRRARHLKQSELAAKVGVDQHRISEYERGIPPSQENLQALAGFFGVPEAHADRLMQDVPENIAGVPAPPSLAEAIRNRR